MDDHNNDRDGWEGFPGDFGPYRPVHPWREAFTFGLFVIAAALAIWWMFTSLWGQFIG